MSRRSPAATALVITVSLAIALVGVPAMFGGHALATVWMAIGLAVAGLLAACAVLGGFLMMAGLVAGFALWFASLREPPFAGGVTFARIGRAVV